MKKRYKLKSGLELELFPTENPESPSCKVRFTTISVKHDKLTFSDIICNRNYFGWNDNWKIEDVLKLAKPTDHPVFKDYYYLTLKEDSGGTGLFGESIINYQSYYIYPICYVTDIKHNAPFDNSLHWKVHLSDKTYTEAFVQCHHDHPDICGYIMVRIPGLNFSSVHADFHVSSSLKLWNLYYKGFVYNYRLVKVVMGIDTLIRHGENCYGKIDELATQIADNFGSDTIEKEIIS